MRENIFPCIGGKEEKEKLKKEQEKQEREKMQFLVSNFTEDQLDRYAMYRRASFPKATIRRLMQTITGNSSMGKFCPILDFTSGFATTHVVVSVRQPITYQSPHPLPTFQIR